jgi:alpha-ketoglutarate-dependent taurine dioxygenase
MKITKILGLGDYGHYVDDTDLTNISYEEWMEIGNLQMKGLVTIIRNVNCDKNRYAQLVSKWGGTRPTAVTAIKYREKYNKDFKWVVDRVFEDSPLIDEGDRIRMKMEFRVTEITEDGYPIGRIAGGFEKDGMPKGFFPDGELLWHSNESGTLTSCPGLSLMGWQNMVGSATGFNNTATYYESVTDSMRSEFDQMVLIHRYTNNRINPGHTSREQDETFRVNMVPTPDAEIPLVWNSPGGIRGLHFSPNTTHKIKGMNKKESDKIINMISKEVFSKKYTYDHWYTQNNDICFFDNSIMCHRRLGSIDGRVAYRIPHDYTYLQDGPYQPHIMPDYQKKYNRQIRRIMHELKNKSFILPKRTLSECIEDFFDRPRWD